MFVCTAHVRVLTFLGSWGLGVGKGKKRWGEGVEGLERGKSDMGSG